MPQLSPEERQARIDKIVADHKAGRPRHETAEELGISHVRLKDFIAEQMRHIPGFAAQRVTVEDKQRRREAYARGLAEGWTLTQIVEAAGCSYYALSGWIADNYRWDLGKLPRALPGETVRLEGKCPKRVNIPREPLHKPKTERFCLRCRDAFQSEGPGNRLCAPCGRRSADMSPFEPNPGGHRGRRVGTTQRVSA
jgi:hypothetical protein